MATVHQQLLISHHWLISCSFPYNKFHHRDVLHDYDSHSMHVTDCYHALTYKCINNSYSAAHWELCMIMLRYILYHILQLLEEFKFICNLANNPEDVFATNWQTWRSKIVKYSRLESKPSMMDHLELLNSATTNELSWGMLLLFPFKFVTLVLAHCYVVAMVYKVL